MKFLKKKLGAVWADGYTTYSIFGHLQQWTFATNAIKMAKVFSKFCQIWKKHNSKIAQDFSMLAKVAKFAKPGHTEFGREEMRRIPFQSSTDLLACFSSRKKIRIKIKFLSESNSKLFGPSSVV